LVAGDFYSEWLQIASEEVVMECTAHISTYQVEWESEVTSAGFLQADKARHVEAAQRIG
jgi:protoheme ferro-lyase